ncbi:DUF2804 domain-containing protein [Timonella senegalensis]|uniref:DUF2804 domain-containing protein n=3 Tax=Timonella senegalensis TaxID=1465825 RepID=UPI0028AED103|nr:DUF2804 domain-containing protein [Timonella senegalensis]
MPSKTTKPSPIHERELTSPTTLSGVRNGKPTLAMNPDAHGWSRTPVLDTALYNGPGAWGRNKRWEYWGIMTPTHIIGITISTLDYAGVCQFYLVDRETYASMDFEATAPFARGVDLPSTYAQGDASFTSKRLTQKIVHSQDATHRTTRITANGVNRPRFEDVGHNQVVSITDRAMLDVTIERPLESEALHVVVPWSANRFQYTIKEPALRAHGRLVTNKGTYYFGDDDDKSFAVLDHGRGRWPYSMVWNWAAGSGVVDGKLIGLQLGDKWTDGTGSTENAIIIDGKLTKISEELAWEYDRKNWLNPWRVKGSCIDATFTPVYERIAETSLLVLSGETHQCFGTWSGVYRHPDGTTVSLDGLEGWAEEARNRW